MLIVYNQLYDRVWNSSGARGFFGDGTEYWYHKWFPIDYGGSTFVAKTTTLDPRVGNMPLDKLNRPSEWKPKCIHIKPFSGVVLNAVGLSGPGADVLLYDGRWQSRNKPFFISFMAVDDSDVERIRQTSEFIRRLARWLPQFNVVPGLQINFSCPNVAHGSFQVEEAMAVLDQVRLVDLRSPIAVKLNALVPASDAFALSRHPRCDAIVCSNTIPWGQIPDRIDWNRLYGERSPLEQYGGGGLSGKPLLPVVADWIREMRSLGVNKPLIACGGILCERDVDTMAAAGADAVEIGCVSLLRPWRVGRIVRHATSVAKWWR